MNQLPSRRLDDTDLAALESAAAHGGTAHPVDILRLVEEVRWYKANTVTYHLPTSTPRVAVSLPHDLEDGDAPTVVDSPQS